MSRDRAWGGQALSQQGVQSIRVLLFADHCNPEFSSEPLVGYNTCRSIAEQVDEAVVVTQIRNRDAIERAGVAGAEVVYLDTEYVGKATAGAV